MADFTAQICATPARPRGLFGTLAAYIGLAKQRRALANLTSDQRRDIGISAQDAAKEAARPVWDAPDHWMR